MSNSLQPPPPHAGPTAVDSGQQVTLPLADAAFLYAWAAGALDHLPADKLPPEPHLTQARARIARIGEQLRAAN